MATVTLLDSGSNGWETAAVGSITSASITPGADCVLVLMLAGTIDANSPNLNMTDSATCTSSGSGPSWTLHASAPAPGAFDSQACIYRATIGGTSPGSFTVTWDPNAGQPMGAMHWVLFRVTGHDTSTPFGGFKVQPHGPGTGSQSITLSAAPASADVTLAINYAVDDPTSGGATFDSASGTWTETTDGASSGKRLGFNSGHRTGSTSTTVSWTSVNTGSESFDSAQAAIVVKAAAGGGAPTDLTVDAASHAHTAENISLGAGPVSDLVVANAAHAHAADGLWLRAPAFKTALGSNGNVTSGTTLAITTTADIARGDLIVVRCAADNLSATTPTMTCADSGSNTYTSHAYKGQNATGGSGVVGGIMCAQAAAALATGATITVTLSGAVTAKAAYATCFTGVDNVVRSAAVTASGSGTAASSGASGTVNNGDLVIGAVAAETRASATGDADTTNGSWSTLTSVLAAATGTDNTRVEINGQYKFATAAGAQTYDNTITSTDWAALIVPFQISNNVALVIQDAYHGCTSDNVTVVHLNAVLNLGDGGHATSDSGPITLTTAGGGGGTTVSDNFNRADTTSIDQGNSVEGLGSSWKGSAWHISSNQAKRGNLGSNDYCVYLTDLGTTDHYCQADVTRNGQYGIVNVRRPADDTANGYLFYVDPSSGAYTLAKSVGGTFTVITTATGDSAPATCTLRIEVEGTALRGYRDGVLKVSSSSGASEATLNSNTRIGFNSNFGPVFDNFSGGSLAAPSTNLVISDCAHAHSAGNIDLGGITALSVDAGVHVHTAANILFGGIQDEFEAFTIDAALWDNILSGSGSVNQVSGLFEAQIAATGGSTNYAAIRTDVAYDFTGYFLQVQAVNVANPLNGVDTFMKIGNPFGTDQFMIVKNGANLIARIRQGGSNTDLASVAYNPSTMSYWRIRNSGANTVWEYSGDGGIWTTLHTLATPFAITSMHPEIGAGKGTSLSTTDLSQFDHLIMAPNVAAVTLANMDTTLGHSSPGISVAEVKVLANLNAAHAHTCPNIDLSLVGGGGSYTDNFDRANTTHTDGGGTGLGASWVSNRFFINTNQAVPITGQEAWAAYAQDLGSPNQFAEVDVSAGGGNYLCVYVRAPSTAIGPGGTTPNSYQANLDPDGVNYEIGRNVSGSYIMMVNATSGFTHNRTGRIRLEVNGTQIKFFLNGNLINTLTDTNITTGNYGGINAFSPDGTARYDNLQIGNLSASGVTLTMQDALHDHTSQSVPLGGQYVLQVQDAAHAHAAQNIDLQGTWFLVIPANMHATTSDQISFTTIRYPVTVSGRKWLDQFGQVFVLKTLSSWSMAQHLSNAEITTAITNAKNRGFNAITVAPWGNGPFNSWTSNKYQNKAGQPFFATVNNGTTPGTPYQSPLGAAWASMDWVMQEATRLDMCVVFSFFFSWLNTGTVGDINAASNAQCVTYGQNVANRYASYRNIIWHCMVDYNMGYPGPGGEGAKLDQVMKGIAGIETSQGIHRMIVAEPENDGANGYDQFISKEGAEGSGYAYWRLDANSLYSWQNDGVQQADTDYNQPGATGEAIWDSEPPYVNNFNGQQLRERVWSVYIRNYIGINFGHEQWWPFGQPSQVGPAGTNWQAALNDTDVVHQGYANAMVDTYIKDAAWIPITPDGTFLTTGLGTGETKAAVGRSNRAILAYIPTNRPVVVDTTVMPGTNPVRIRWWDPTNNTFTVVTNSEAQQTNRSVTMPGAHADSSGDYLLVVELDQLAIDDGMHAHSAENIPLGVPIINLIMANGQHTHTAANVPIVELFTLVVQPAAHAHTADSFNLTQTLTVAVANHAHTAQNVDFTHVFVLTVQQADHAHTATSLPPLVIGLAVQDAFHGHQGENIAFGNVQTLSVQDAFHGLTSQDAIIGPILQVQNGAHSNVSDVVPVAMVSDLVVQPANHGHTAQNSAITLTDNLTIQPGLHVHTAESNPLVQFFTLEVSDALHDHVGENVGLGGTQELAISPDFIGHTAQNIDLSTGEVMEVQDSFHDHTVTEPVLETQPLTLVVNPGVHTHVASLVQWEAGIDHGVTRVTVARGFKFRITPR